MDDQEFLHWLDQEAQKLHQQGWAPGSPSEVELVRHWKVWRPKMCQRLGPNLPKLAFVLWFLADEARDEYLQAGWPPTDAREQAAKEWLLQGPEDEDSYYRQDW